MTSGKEKRAQIQAKRRQKRIDDRAKHARSIMLQRAQYLLAGQSRDMLVVVDPARLAATGSYDVPDFVKRGAYVPKPFTCRDCGVEQVWTPRQQQWWYEVAKGDPFTTASRCRACRKKERDRKSAARRASEEGRERKRARQEVK